MSGDDGKGLEEPGGGRPEVLRIVIADDDALVRRVVRDALQDAEGFQVVADAANGREALELSLHYKPDIVLMDVRMPEMTGIEAARVLHEREPGVRIVLLSIADEDEITMDGLRAGAAGFVSKNIDVVRLPQILESVAAGEAAVTRSLTTRLIEELRRGPGGGAGMRPVRSNLTDREWEVLDLLEGGDALDEIADRLVLSLETVRSHLKSLYRKLDVHSRDELLAKVEELRSPDDGD